MSVLALSRFLTATLAQARTFENPKKLVAWHKKGNWQKKFTGAPGLFCVAQNWTYIGPPPGVSYMVTHGNQMHFLTR